MKECLTFTPLYIPRIWGGRELETHFGRNLATDEPIGESWELVDREGYQSVVNAGPLKGKTLNELWRDYRDQVFGVNLDGPRFPLLIKILDAAEALSAQVHPPASVSDCHGGEPKTELWYIVKTTPSAGIYVGLRAGVDQATFENGLKDGQVGAMLHYVPTRPDSFIFIPCGRVHAIDTGNVIFEIQQNSDTTYRIFDWNRKDAQGKPRALHIAEALRCIDFADQEPALGTAQGESLVDCEHFRVDRWEIHGPRAAHDAPAFSVFQVVDGEIAFQDRSFRPGDLFLVPAQAYQEQIRPVGKRAIVIRTTLPDDGAVNETNPLKR